MTGRRRLTSPRPSTELRHIGGGRGAADVRLRRPPWSLGGLQGARHRDDVGPRTPRARHGEHGRACPPWHRPTPAGSTPTGGIDGHELKVLTCNEQQRLGGRRRSAPGGRPTRTSSRSSARTASTAGRSCRRWRRPGIPYIGGYGASDEEFTSSLSYPVNGGQAALLAGNGAQLARQLRAGRAGAARHAAPATSMPGLLDAACRAAASAPPTTSGARGRHRLLDEVTCAEAARRPLGGDAGGRRLRDGGARRPHGDVLRLLPAARTDGPQVRIASVLGSVGQPLVNRTGGADSPFEGAYVTGWYPAAERRPLERRCAR